MQRLDVLVNPPFGRLAPLAQLALRLALAVPFFRSGLTKWDGFGRLSDSAVWLFAEEFRLHVFGAQFPYPAPALMAWASGLAEITLPVLLVLGLGTRWAALGLLGMTAVIQLTVRTRLPPALGLDGARAGRLGSRPAVAGSPAAETTGARCRAPVDFLKRKWRAARTALRPGRLRSA